MSLVMADGVGLVDFAIIPHVEYDDPLDAANAEKWAGRLPVPSYALDDASAVQVSRRLRRGRLRRPLEAIQPLASRSKPDSQRGVAVRGWPPSPSDCRHGRGRRTTSARDSSTFGEDVPFARVVRVHVQTEALRAARVPGGHLERAQATARRRHAREP
jgi:hypothetical protein